MGAQDYTRATDQPHTVGHDHHDDSSGQRCGTFADERNRYYTGKYMTARDFRDEQDYFLSRHRLHNRLMHGSGVICGLQVTPHRADCPGHVVVSPGVAIDCCGRELVLHEQIAVPIWLPPEESEDQANQRAGKSGYSAPPATGQSAYGAPPATEPPETLQYLLYLYYDEQPVEFVPALYAEDCSTKRLEANRVREFARLDKIPWDEAHRNDPRIKGCWSQPGIQLEPCSKGCGDDIKAEGCLEPACSCGLGVPLALITLHREGDEYRVDEQGIAMDGRKTLWPPTEYLTHIVQINWPHGGSVSLDYLRNTMGGRLEVCFDRKLAVPYHRDAAEPQFGAPYELSDQQCDEEIGINRRTFVVQFAGVQDDLEFLRTDRAMPPQLDQDCRAVFTIRPERLDSDDDDRNVAGNTLYVTLKCDFILDCNGNAVDGNFLRANFPTGDGIEGGTFESWFRVTK